MSDDSTQRHLGAEAAQPDPLETAEWRADSMFGFQRVGDLIWAAADQRARGFLLGATAGRTTLGGEGLQHQDGSSLVQAATVPNCRACDPCFAYEFAVILDHGMRRMLEQQRDEFFYVTLMNENYAQPSLPAGAEEGIVKGLYRVATEMPTGGVSGGSRGKVRLVGAGTCAVERRNRPHPHDTPQVPYVRQCLRSDGVPVIAASDYVRAWPQLIAEYVEAPFSALGTDGFGRSDTRAALRRFFEVDRGQVVLAALTALRAQGLASADECAQAIAKYGIDADAAAPWDR